MAGFGNEDIRIIRPNNRFAPQIGSSGKGNSESQCAHSLSILPPNKSIKRGVGMPLMLYKLWLVAQNLRLKREVALGKVGTEVKKVCMEHELERVAIYWESTRDLVEQHPDLLIALLITITLMLIPDSWLLRPVLSLFGFGPLGPGKGTAASWAQRVFYGAAVSKGSWFAYLDSVGMARGGILRPIRARL
ncbi:hypothetical protein R3P38DRAFT_3340863 [Favolaschia claudopus]|uniref:Uncharacterized protein n=1 Tax=Favolaschia claudopus TaxID=2862362 RepID=A0AAW0ED23_9AGAR